MSRTSLNSTLQGFKFILVFIPTCFIVIFASIVSLLVFFYRKILDLILSYKYGKNYGGLMPAFDNAWSLENFSKNILELVTINSTELNFDEFVTQTRKQVYEKFFKNPEIFPKLSCIREQFLGYYFMLKIGYYDEVVRVLKIDDKDFLSDGDLMSILEQIQNDDLPKNSRSFLQFVIIDKPFLFSDKTTKNNFIVIIRVHHSVGDGLALSRLFFQYFTPYLKPQGRFQDIIEKKIARKSSKSTNLIKHIDNTCKNIYKIIDEIPNFMIHHTMKNSERNLLKGRKLTGKKIMSFYLEPEAKHVELVKKIKNHYTETTFSDIIFTAFSAAFSEYFKSGVNNSSHLTVYVPTSLLNTRNMDDRIILTNSFANLILQLPISNESFEEKLDKIRKQWPKARKATQTLISYYAFIFLSYLPSCILTSFSHKFIENSSVVTMVPGSEKIPFFENTELEEQFLTLPTCECLGLAIYIGTFNNKFQLTLVADSGVIPDRQCGVSVLKRVLSNVELFYQEIMRK